MKKPIAIFIFISIVLMSLACFALAWAVTPADATPDKIISNFWTSLSAVTLIATLAVVTYYTYETYELRKAAIAGNELSMRPIIVFLAGEPLFQVENRGSGAAINTCLIIWSKNQFIVTPSQNVSSALPPNERRQFTPSQNMDSTALKKNFPEYTSLIENIVSQNHEVIFCFYMDIFKNHLYSIANGENSNFKSAFEHGNLGKV